MSTIKFDTPKMHRVEDLDNRDFIDMDRLNSDYAKALLIIACSNHLNTRAKVTNFIKSHKYDNAPKGAVRQLQDYLAFHGKYYWCQLLDELMMEQSFGQALKTIYV